MKKISGKKSPGTFFIHTLGCKTNQSESDSISRELSMRGLKPVLPEDSPDIIILNTCTVTSAADRKSRQMIRRLKRISPDSLFAAAGCFTVFNEKFLKKNRIDLVVANSEKTGIARILGLPESPEEGKNTFSGHSRALLKIQDGCEQNCSYCIVPVVRGGYASKPYEQVVKEASRFEREGHEEVVLTGIHIGRYGIDLMESNKEVKDLYGLVCGLLKNTAIKRIRLSSLEVNELSEDIADLISASKGRIARHLHIPLQSGSDKILEKMNRPYSSGLFIKKIKRLKKAVPDMVLTTDVIAGFPGETESDFLKTLGMVKEINFSKVHVFKYSPRKNTSAFLMGDIISEREKKIRSDEMKTLADSLRKDFISSLAGRYIYPVCEEYDSSCNVASGTSEQYARAYFTMEYDDFIQKKGKIIRVFAESPHLDGVHGTVPAGCNYF